MDSARPGNPINLLTLKEAAQYLAVSTDILLAWNEHDILKPTITANGEVAYTKNQLDKFKSIQESSKAVSHEMTRNFENITPSKSLSPQKQDMTHKPSHQQNNYSQINNYHFHNQVKDPGKEIKATISLKKLAFTFSFFSIALVLVIIASQIKLNPLSNIKDKGITYDAHNATIETTNEITSKDTINNDKQDSNKLDDVYNSNDEKVSADNSNDEKVAILQSILGDSDTRNAENKINSEDEIVTYGQKAKLRTNNESSDYIKNSDIQSEVFDTEGNIKVSSEGPSEKDLLATALGTTGLTQNQELVRQSSGTAGVITFAILGLLFIYFLYSSKKQLNYSSGNYSELTLQPTSFNTQNDLKWEKILEVTQKTDGSVVIVFQGKEYKVSKPELDSESDKFIERLMQLTNSGEKQIEYDSLSDQSLSLSSPLSKIVTRLGFVGLKRDLFFPRTSKSRVYFRKYLTLDDLFSMNLTIEDLSDKIDKVN